VHRFGFCDYYGSSRPTSFVNLITTFSSAVVFSAAHQDLRRSRRQLYCYVLYV
jgi:hypothetical protein